MRKVNLPKNYLIHQHLKLKKSTKEIAKINNCTQSTVSRWLTIYGIPRNGFQVEDLTGKMFGRWTVLKRSDNDPSGKVRWEAKCTCGNVSCVDSYTIKKGISTKCKKCRMPTKDKNPFWTGHKEISGTMWGRILKNAHVRNREINVDIKYVWNLFEKQSRKCALSGLPIKFGSYDLKEETTASLDRIDSKQGYVKNNIQWIHKVVNKMKQDLNQESFLDFCKTITEYNQ